MKAERLFRVLGLTDPALVEDVTRIVENLSADAQKLKQAE